MGKPMEVELLHRYIADANQAYQVCLAGLGLANSGSDLSTLTQAARNREIDRRGEVKDQDGVVYEYHVHGSGYSFKESGSGKEIHFDITTIDGVLHIRFSAWKMQRYASSVGESMSENGVAEQLKDLSRSSRLLKNIVELDFDYFIFG